MLVKCERCGAGYDFPVDQLPPDGLRAKCAACGHVMWIRGEPGGDESDFDDVEMSVDGSVDAPPHVFERPPRIIQPVPLGRIGRALGVSTAPPSVDAPPVAAPMPGMSAPPPEVGPPPPQPPEATPAPPGQVPPKVVDVSEDSMVSRDDPQASVGFRIEPGGREARDAAPGLFDESEGTPGPFAEPSPAPSEPDPNAAAVDPTDTGDVEPRRPEPSMVIDLDHLREDQPAPEETPPPDPNQAAAFAPLASTGSMPTTNKPAMREASTVLVAAQRPAEELGELQPVRPPSLFRLALLIFLLALGGLVAFISSANDWRPVWEEPELSARVAFGMAERKAPPRPRAPDVVEAEPMRGKLEVRDLRVEVIKLDRRTRAAVVTGRLVNASNRRHARIELEATLSDAPGALALRTRRLGCCTAIAPSQLESVARDAGHAHFQGGAATAQLDPEQSRPFTVVFRDVDLEEAHAAVAVKYSEPERLQK